MREQFIKCSRVKALNIQIKRTKYAIDYRKSLLFDTIPVFSDIPSIGNISRDMSILLDYLYLTIDGAEDVSKINKKLMETINKFEINAEEFYILKYKASKLLQISAASNELLSLDMEEITRVSIIYFCFQLIEFIKYKTNKRLIIGAKGNDVKYIPNERLLLDNVNSKFVTEEDISIFIKNLNKLTMALKEKHGMPIQEAVSSANDKIDELFNGIRHDRIILDICGEDVRISPKSRFHTLETGSYTILRKEEIENRNLIAEEFITVHYTEGYVRTMRVKDIDIDSDYHCILVNYVTQDGDEDTQILPTMMHNILYEVNMDLRDKLVELLEGKTKGQIVSNDFWQVRLNKDRDKLVRQYQRKIITVHMHRAKMGNPSKEALALAKKYHVKLKTGETIVKTHPREYGKDK